MEAVLKLVQSDACHHYRDRLRYCAVSVCPQLRVLQGHSLPALAHSGPDCEQSVRSTPTVQPGLRGIINVKLLAPSRRLASYTLR
ncbi:hypothetical protein J6590_021751 [Homalodisca vitripennis]|nr:hypothetical protein J6590_021751 [Homalodisca vitripennis]